MPPPLEEALARWRQAGLIDAETAGRISAYEAGRASPVRWRWPVITALAAGGLMMVAGVLLFVAAHWEELAPTARMGLLLGGLAAMHAGGAATTDRFPALATTLHAVGTGFLGAAVFLAGQTWHLETEWPLGFLLWALGAWVAYGLIGSWPQLVAAALLTPAWIVSEWIDRAARLPGSSPMPGACGLLLLALVYLHADGRDRSGIGPTSLGILGAIAVFPLALMTVVLEDRITSGDGSGLTLGARAFWWSIAIAGPIILALRLRGREAWMAAIAALWVVAGANLGRHAGVLPYLWGVAGAVGLTASGVHDGSRRRINAGIIGFGLTVVIFYFSSVLDRLGRATSLLSGGVVFLLLGWFLERFRRRLLAGAPTEPT